MPTGRDANDPAQNHCQRTHSFPHSPLFDRLLSLTFASCGEVRNPYRYVLASAMYKDTAPAEGGGCRHSFERRSAIGTIDLHRRSDDGPRPLFLFQPGSVVDARTRTPFGRKARTHVL